MEMRLENDIRVKRPLSRNSVKNLIREKQVVYSFL